MPPCDCETEQQHEHSPGLVAGGETVCRGAYWPIAYNEKSGNLSAQIVRPLDLFSGKLSIWRQDRDANFGLEGVMNELVARGPAEKPLKAVIGLLAQEVRALRMADYDTQVFCVTDDCETDEAGGWHPEHAGIKLADIDGVEWDRTGAEFIAAKELLVAKFKANVVCSIYPRVPV